MFKEYFSIEIQKDFDEVLMKLVQLPFHLLWFLWEVKCNGKIEKKEGFHPFHRFIFQTVLCLLLILVIYKYIFHQSGDVIDICILEAAMVPMITAAIIASGS